jgi:hypothetical protein
MSPAWRDASSLPPRPPGPNNPAQSQDPHPIPLRLLGLHVFSPFGGRGLAMLQARGGLHGE